LHEVVLEKNHLMQAKSLYICLRAGKPNTRSSRQHTVAIRKLFQRVAAAGCTGVETTSP